MALIVGMIPDDLDPKWGMAYAMGDHETGFKIGNYVYYRHYYAQIIDIKKDKLNLVACGWVKKKKCRLTE